MVILHMPRSIPEPHLPSCRHSCSPTPQPSCLRALSKAPTAGQEPGPSLHPITHVGAHPQPQFSPLGQRTSQCFWLSHIIPPQRTEAERQLRSHLLPEPCASTEIPDSKAFLGIQLSPSIIITIPLLTGDPCHHQLVPHSPRGMHAMVTVPFHQGHREM